MIGPTWTPPTTRRTRARRARTAPRAATRDAHSAAEPHQLRAQREQRAREQLVRRGCRCRSRRGRGACVAMSSAAISDASAAGATIARSTHHRRRPRRGVARNSAPNSKRPHEIELLFHRERPEVQDRALVDARREVVDRLPHEVPVRDEEERGLETADRVTASPTATRPDRVDDRDDEQRDRRGRGQDPAEAPRVEAAEVDAPASRPGRAARIPVTR